MGKKKPSQNLEKKWSGKKWGLQKSKKSEQKVGVQKNTSKKLKQNCGQKMWWKKISAAMPNTCKNKLW